MSIAVATYDLAKTMAAMRAAQNRWHQQGFRQRSNAIGHVAGLIAEHADAVVSDVVRPVSVSTGEIWASEVLPVAEACRYVARRGARVLARRRLSRRDGPWWMGSIRVWETRVPLGIVLVIGPSNYPLLLPGVQLIQALAAGNGVLIKPAPGCSRVIERLVGLCKMAEVPSELIHVLPTEPEAARAAIEIGVDKVVLTGSYQTGKAVARQLAEKLTPAAFELSGNDAVFVLNDADLERTAKAVSYALCLNGGQTCIAPRRLFATDAHIKHLVPLLRKEIDARHGNVDEPRCRCACSSQNLDRARTMIIEALAGGAELVSGDLAGFDLPNNPRPIVLKGVSPKMRVATEDLFAPVLSVIEVPDMAVAREWAQECRYALGASVFGPTEQAARYAAQVTAGCVTLNDVLVPTADPRVSFGGWRASGYGVTRGLEGLREMTKLKVTCERRGRWLPHLSTDAGKVGSLMHGLLLVRHGRSMTQRWSGIRKLMHAMRK